MEVSSHNVKRKSTSASTQKHRRVSHGRRRSSVLSIDSPEAVRMDPIRQVSYNDKNHWAVLTQMYGSVWPKVLPFCLFNMALTLGVFALKNWYGYDNITTEQTGHRFMAMILSFLSVARAKITYARYMKARGHLSTTYRSCRELVQHMCVFTQDDTTEGARLWRNNVAYRTILLLRVTMAAMEFESKQTNPWEVPELTGEDRDELRENLMMKPDQTGGTVGSNDATTHSCRLDRLAHGKRTLEDECFRAPIILAYDLRREIMEQRSGAYLEKPFRHVIEELKLLDSVGDFVKAFQGLNTLITTPFPFPLVQMSRTFLFLWVFTLPFVLCHDPNKYPYAPLLIIFLTTYGFMGLEYVCMELHDPFGDDPNDFDDLGMAQLVFEDIYIAIYRLDGETAAYDLRRKIVQQI